MGHQGMTERLRRGAAGRRGGRVKFIGAGARPGRPQVDHDRVVTIPNLLTVVRFMGVPLFIWLVLAQKEYWAGVVVLAVMAGTDWIDGYIARRFDQASKLGRVLDPIADRLALLALTLSLFHGHPDLPVSVVGKVRTGLLLLGTPLLLLSRLDTGMSATLLTAAWVVLGLGLVGHWIAAYNYFWAMLRKGREQQQHDG